MLKFIFSVTLLVAMTIFAAPAFASGGGNAAAAPKASATGDCDKAEAASAEDAQRLIKVKSLKAVQDVAELKLKLNALRKQIASLTRIQRRGREGLQKQIDALKGTATTTTAEIAHKCASFGSEKERELCLNFEVKQADTEAEGAKAEATLLTSIVGGERCRMHLNAEVGGPEGSKTYVWKCQPAVSVVRDTRYERETEVITKDGIRRSKVKLDHRNGGSSETSGDPSATTPPAQLPAYPVVAPTRPTRWGLVVGAGLLGGAVGAGVGYATGNPAQLHHGLNGPAEYRPGTQTKRAIGGAAIGAVVTAGITFLVDRLTAD